MMTATEPEPWVDKHATGSPNWYNQIKVLFISFRIEPSSPGFLKLVTGRLLN